MQLHLMGAAVRIRTPRPVLASGQAEPERRAGGCSIFECTLGSMVLSAQRRVTGCEPDLVRMQSTRV